MKIKIVFYKSSSKYYDTVCLQCENFGEFTQQKSINTLVLTIHDLRTKHQELKYTLDTIKNWSKTEYYVDDTPVSLQRINCLIEILDCERQCSACINLEEHCYSEGGWGCKYLRKILLRKEMYYSTRSNHWYEYGHFVDGEWIIDKDRIQNTLVREVAETHADICDYFSIERMESALSLLPEKISVTDDEESEWEYKYREAPLGMHQTEIIGIKPRKKEEEISWGISVRNFSNREKADIEIEENQKKVPSVTFADIGGIDEIVQQVREVIELPLVAPAIFDHYHIKPHKGILLYGPPGCGKTLIAKAIANEIQAHFIAINGPEILNKYIGESESNLRRIFDEAKRLSPAIIYFDEFDSISSTRDADGNPHMATVVNQLLTLMDGIDDTSQICAIASTNRIDMIDDAIRRPGRFDYIIEVKKPSPQGCKAIFQIHTSRMPIDAKFDKDKFVEKYLLGCSGAEIAFVASEAAYNSIRRTIDLSRIFESEYIFTVSNENIILESDFVKAVLSLKDSRKKADNAKYRYGNS